MKTIHINIVAGTTPNPIIVTAKSNRAPMRLSGCTVKSLIKNRKGVVILDLEPEIIDEVGGKIRIAPTDEMTAPLISETGLRWDLILTLPGGEILPPLVGGSVIITTNAISL